MAFKRDGDDIGLLNKLRGQRVAELLSCDIPEDEAFLMKNGRVACTVCFHRPVFDTVSMLAVHRGGKKHAANLVKKEAEKEELSALLLKREQEQFLKDGKTYSPNINGSQKPLGFHPLLLSAPYDPRVKKSKKNSNSEMRKVRVDLSSQAAPPHAFSSQSPDGATVSNIHPDATSETNLPGYSAPKLLSNSDFIPQTISQYRMMQKHEAQERFAVKPYQRKAVSSERENKARSQNACQQTIHDLNTPLQTENGNAIGVVPQVSNVNDLGEPSKVYVHEKFHRKRKQPAPTIISSVTSEKQARAEKYLNLRGAGWKKDLSGNWVKDEDAEFDSDEEPPDLP